MRQDGKKIKLIYWIPRILTIFFILFLSLFSLDIFDLKLGFWGTLVGLFMHNIPVFILTGVLLISWKYEIVGGIVFIISGALYLLSMLINMLKSPFEIYMLTFPFIIAGPAFLIGILFLTNWLRKKKHKTVSEKK